MLAKLLHQGEGFPVDDGGMRVLEDLPFLRRTLDFLLVLEGLGGATEIYRIAAVFLFTEDVSNCGRPPVVRYGGWLAAIPADIAPMLRRRRHFGSFQSFGDLRGTEAVHAPSKDLAHSLGCFLIHDPAVFVFRVFHVAVWRVSIEVFPCFPFGLHHSADFLACIFCIPLVDDVPKRGKLVVALLTVHSIVDSNKVNIVLREHDLSIHSHLQDVTAQTGHILENDPLDNTCFKVRNHFLEPRAVKGGAGDAIVNIKTDILPAMVKGILL